MSTMVFLAVFLYRRLEAQWGERIKSMEKAVDACVFAKGELEKSFIDSQKEHQRVFNADREAFHTRIEHLLVQSTRRGKRNRTGG